MNRTESQNNEKALTYRKAKEYKKQVLNGKLSPCLQRALRITWIHIFLSLHEIVKQRIKKALLAFSTGRSESAPPASLCISCSPDPWSSWSFARLPLVYLHLSCSGKPSTGHSTVDVFLQCLAGMDNLPWSSGSALPKRSQSSCLQRHKPVSSRSAAYQGLPQVLLLHSCFLAPTQIKS